MKTKAVYINAEGKPHGNCKRLKCTNGKDYNSFREAMIDFNASYTSIRNAVKNGTVYKGHRFALESEKDKCISMMQEQLTENETLKAKAAAWDAYQAELEAARKAEEKRLAEIAKAEEEARKAEAKRQKEKEKTKARVERLRLQVERKYNLYHEALNQLNNAEIALEAFDDEMEMEDVA